MTRRRVIVLFVPYFFSILLSFVVLFFSSCRNEKRPVNVVLIVVDTLRADHLGCYGYTRSTTPHIDRLAAESVLFKNAYSLSPWTTPSVASLFTSQYPSVLGYRVYPIELDETFRTLAEIFKRNGCITGGIISNVFLSAKLGFGQGFDTYDEEASLGIEGISSPAVTEKAISFLKKNRNDNFFLYLHYNDPHYNYHLHQNYDYDPEYRGQLFGGQSIHEIREALPGLGEEDIAYINALYDSEISFTDEHVGLLLQTLKELDLYDKTMIVFTADHGEEFAEREDPWIGHAIKVYQEMIRVPLLIKKPGNETLLTVEDNVGLIDVAPTLVKSLKLKARRDFEGIAINLEKGVRPKKTYIVSETLREANKHSVIFKGWKYIFDQEKNKKEFYDLEGDPGELNNLAKKMRDKTREYEQMLYDWSNSTFEKRNRLRSESRIPEFSEEQIEILKSLGYIK